MPKYSIIRRSHHGDNVETREFPDDKAAIDYAREFPAGMVTIYRDGRVVDTVLKRP